MILEIQHETQLDYTATIAEWMAEVRMEPLTDERQSCHSFHLRVSQPTSVFRYLDGFGNHVHHFNLLLPTQQVKVLAASVVETETRRVDPMSSFASFPLEFDNVDLAIFDFLALRGPVSMTSLLQPLLNELQPRSGARVGPWVFQVAEAIRSRFTYARYVTEASSPIDDVLKYGKGVCQDFAHLMIAVCRSYGVPARYVSGYIHRENKESQSHAWVEAWLPDRGWVGFDPTNGCMANDSFVKVAVGRDYSDVPPNKGTYRGQGQESMQVRVATRELDRLPAISWQERLPPIDTPLTIIQRRVIFPEADEQVQVQQQQQQQS